LLSADAARIVRYRRVSTDYFATLGIPLRDGRLFDLRDAEGITASVVIDEATATLYFPGERAIGKRIRPRDTSGEFVDRWLDIVGVVSNTATATLTESSAVPKLYVPLRGSMWADVPSPHNMSYIVRTSADPAQQIATVRKLLASMNPQVALARPERLEDIMSRARAPRAMTMLLLIISAVMAIVVGTIGVYAVMAYAVAQRSLEIGVRLAVGATPSQVMALIVRDGGAVVCVGVAAGLAGTMLLGSLVDSLLYGVTALDWLTRLSAALIIGVLGAVATWWPAVRSTRRNPLSVLRTSV